MSKTTSWTESQCAQYEFSISLNASAQRVWRALTDQIGAWWLPHFHMLGEDSIVELELRAGGRLFEKNASSELLWYTVIAIDPGKSLELAGYCSAKYGGPATTMLAIELIPQSDGQTQLRVSDSLFGRVTEGLVQSLTAGWQELFTHGFKAFVEKP
jgi:uncharacterized protein YndB with AHSA1/START domain